MHSDLVLWIVVGTALAFDFTNGFHDTANAVATSISTRAMPPKVAVTLAAVLNFVGAFLSLAVAATIATGIVQADLTDARDRLRRPDRRDRLEPRDLVLRPAVVVLARADRRRGRRGLRRRGPGRRARLRAVEKVVIPALVAPVLALVVAGAGDPRSPTGSSAASRPGPVTRGFRLGQIVSGSLFSLSHGTNDAQKTMGIIFLALIANGNLSATDDVPTWVVVSSATAIAAGTYVGGWRIIRTMGSRIIKMDPAQGFAAQGAGAAVILSASHVGLPAVHHAGDVAARSWAPAPPSGCRPSAGASRATSPSRGC